MLISIDTGTRYVQGSRRRGHHALVRPNLRRGRDPGCAFQHLRRSGDPGMSPGSAEPGLVLVQRQGERAERAVRGRGAGGQWARVMPSEGYQVPA